MLLFFIIKINVILKISILFFKVNISVNVNNILMIIILSINL